jgi:hypothetical protein
MGAFSRGDNHPSKALTFGSAGFPTFADRASFYPTR